MTQKSLSNLKAVHGCFSSVYYHVRTNKVKLHNEPML